MKLYRFRSDPNFTLDELEKNYFYFSLPNELNDPMEGFINLYWEGDKILWKNFLKHYLYTLTNTIINIYILPEAINNPLPIHFDESKFPTKELQNIFEDLRDTFFKNNEVNCFLDYLTNIKHRIYINELKNYLGFLQLLSLSIVLNILKKHEILDWKLPAIYKIGVFDKFAFLMPMVEKQHPDFIKLIFDACYHVKKEMNLSFKMGFKDVDENGIKSFLINEFPNKYVEEVKALAFSTPCIVSFMEDYSSPAFWGYYGNKHKGLCLIFDNGNSDNEIHFDFRTTWGGIGCSTHKVTYQTKYEDVNFFKMLGSISLFAIDKFWLSDWEGNRTEYLRIGDNYLTEEWRNEYNKTLSEAFSIKFPDWQNEKEHRIVLQKELVANDTPDSRKFVYDFKLLKGIIFGLRTDDDYKIRVMNCINKKCEECGRTDFKFYQTEYNAKTGLLNIGEVKI